MNAWVDLHQASEAAAIMAAEASRSGRPSEARALYGKAAELERRALEAVDPGKVRTKAVTTVSAVALAYKAAEYERAEQLAFSALIDPELPPFARRDLRDLVQAIWTESSKQAANASFLPGQVLVSLRGGEVITGGAPLELVVDKAKTIQSMFYRTVEFINGMPFRPRGGPLQSIQDSFRPWLFQAAPGSYQFAVALQQPKQMELFLDRPAPQIVAERLLQILRATTSGDAPQLASVVPDESYRRGFLKLSRNLAPVGTSFETIEFRVPAGGDPVALTADARMAINQALKQESPGAGASPDLQIEQHVGILRAVDLDSDCLQVAGDNGTLRVTGLEDTMDDVIGPMVNKRVNVSVRRSLKGALSFLDIELHE